MNTASPLENPRPVKQQRPAGRPRRASLTSSTNIGVLKLFVSKGLPFVGNVDLGRGFTLLTYDGSAFNMITDNGFFNRDNAYAWSMAEINGRVFVGTFNKDFFSLDPGTPLPRGSSELWYSDNVSLVEPNRDLAADGPPARLGTVELRHPNHGSGRQETVSRHCLEHGCA